MQNVKIDRRKIYGVVIDTETTNGLDDPLFYDVGWQIIDSHGNKYLERSFLNSDILLDMKPLMKTAYYAEKLPAYLYEAWDGQRIVKNTAQIKAILKADCERYGCKFICAHNARFDYKSLNGTQRYLTKSKYRYFTPYGLEWWDTMKMAESVICKMPTYIKFCENNGYMVNSKKPRKTAEILYRFISKNNDFVEHHTGLEDVDIERQILAYCVKQHKPMVKKLWKD